MKRYGHILAMAALLLAPLQGRAQTIVSASIPTDACAGTDDTVSFGLSTDHNIVIEVSQATMGHSEQIFLPDGVYCQPNGCSYRSPIHFTSFQNGATITSVDDIKYLRINMEHSYIGDIYINITCPNNQKADVMRFGGTSTSDCQGTIPAQSKGWRSSTVVENMNKGYYFGIPVDEASTTRPCDPTAADNQPGTGWNYCWSDNTTSGYSYAHSSPNDDGIIYRFGHAHQTPGSITNNSVDSSNVAAHTNFYHPDESFSSLIGCPINGTWYVEVVDGYSQDNGYIFEWELALDPARLSMESCEADSFRIEGPATTRVDDSTFILHTPDAVSSDSTIECRFQVYSSCLGVIDTMLSLVVHPNPIDTIEVNACDRYSRQGKTFIADTMLRTVSTTDAGCAQTTYTHVHINPSYHMTWVDTVDRTELPYSHWGLLFHDAVRDTLLTSSTAAGCDSNETFSLYVRNNYLIITDTTLCADHTPFVWQGRSYSHTTNDTLFYTTELGADSVLVLHLRVLPTNDTLFQFETTENQLPFPFMGIDFMRSTDTTVRFTNQYGCDSTVRLHLTVHENHTYRYQHDICDIELPYTWMGITFTSDSVVTRRFTDIHGADSMLIITLNVHSTYELTLMDTTCDNVPYPFGGRILLEAGLYTESQHTSFGCDSIVNLVLTVFPHFDSLYADTVCFNVGYHFADSVLRHSGDYLNHLTNQWGCDSNITVRLIVYGEDLEACIHAVPMLVTPESPVFSLYTCSRHAEHSTWYIEGFTSDAQQFDYTFPEENDSLPVTLIAYSFEGCMDTAQVVINIDRSAIATPNVFTPNGSDNQKWYPGLSDIVELEIWIYSRDGALMRHLSGIDAAWDGHNTSGELCPQGAYAYRINYRTRTTPKRLHSLNGTILLLR